MANERFLTGQKFTRGDQEGRSGRKSTNGQRDHLMTIFWQSMLELRGSVAELVRIESPKPDLSGVEPVEPFTPTKPHTFEITQLLKAS